MFCTEGIVGYSEIDRNALMTMDAIVDRLQNCSMLHSEKVGAGITTCTERAGTWLLSSWQVDVIRAPRYLEYLKVYTNPYEFRGVFGMRNFLVENDKGEALVKANSVWAYIDRIKGIPMRIPAWEADLYASDVPKLDMEYTPRKIEVAGEFSALQKVAVRSSQLDTNNHVNNCEYIRTFIDVTEIEAIPERMRVEYRTQAHLGDYFYPYVNREGNVCTCELRNADNEVYCTIQYVERI